MKTALEKKNYILIIFLVFSGFLFYGFSENIKGAVLPRIQSDLSLSEFQLGLLLAANAMGYLFACYFSSKFIGKKSIKPIVYICFSGLIISGLLICFSPNYYVLIFAFFVSHGFGGLLEIVLGFIAASAFTQNTGTLMNISHFFYGFSSIFAPLASTFLMQLQVGGMALGWRYTYLIVFALFAIPLFPAKKASLPFKSAESDTSHFSDFLKNPVARLIILSLSLACCAEVGFTGWLINLAEKSYGFAANTAALFLTAYFVSFTVARLVIGPLTEKLGYVKSIRLFSFFACAIVFVGLLTGKPGLFLITATGFFIAPVYPTVMAILSKLFPDKIGAALTGTLTVLGLSLVFANLILGGAINILKSIFTSFAPESGVALAYKAGFSLIGVFLLLSFIVSSKLAKKLKKQDKLV